MQKRDKYNHLNIKNNRYGRLVAIEKVGKSKWLFRCDCGNTVTLNYSRVLYGQMSCGCLKKEVGEKWGKSHKKHGMAKTKLYRRYHSMLDRCYNKNNKGYKRYGGRGITVCDEWINSFTAFYDWATSNGYDTVENGHYWSIDRIDNNKGYTPDNCRFTTATEQVKNRNITILYNYKGRMYSASEFAGAYGITNKSFVYYRAKKGQSLEEILSDWELSHNVPEGYIDLDTYAKNNNVTKTTVNRWIHSGKVEAKHFGRRKWWIKE